MGPSAIFEEEMMLPPEEARQLELLREVSSCMEPFLEHYSQAWGRFFCRLLRACVISSSVEYQVRICFFFRHKTNHCRHAAATHAVRTRSFGKTVFGRLEPCLDLTTDEGCHGEGGSWTFETSSIDSRCFLEVGTDRR